MRQYIRNRFYVRGLTWLGILNTLMAWVFNRVLVLHIGSSTGRKVGWHFGGGTDYPQRH